MDNVQGGGVLVNVLTPPPSGNPVSAPEMDPPFSKILDPPLYTLIVDIVQIEIIILLFDLTT